MPVHQSGVKVWVFPFEIKVLGILGYKTLSDFRKAKNPSHIQQISKRIDYL